MKVAGLLTMVGLVLALLAIGAVLGRDHTLLLQGGGMTTLPLQGDRKPIAHLLPGACQRSMMKIRSGGPTLLPVEMMLTMFMRRGRPQQTAMDLLCTAGPPRSTRAHLLDPAPGPPTNLLLPVTDRPMDGYNMNGMRMTSMVMRSSVLCLCQTELTRLTPLWGSMLYC